MNKKMKIITLLGLSLLMAPTVSHAQRNLIKGASAAIKPLPALTNAVERAMAEQNIRRGVVGGARLIAGSKAVMPPVYNIPGNITFAALHQGAGIAKSPLLVSPSDAWGNFRTQLMDKYDLTTVDAQAVAAGTHNNLEAAEEAVLHGAKPEMALFGALLRNNLELAGKIAEECEVNVNSVLFDNKTILELLPSVGAEYTDERLTWLLEHGLNPNLVMTSGAYQQIERSGFFIELVEKGLDPMATFDETKYTALHWYAERFLKYDYDREGDFLAAWVAKSPKTNVNAQDILGNTPAHYVKAHTSRELNPFGRLRGFDPLIENKEGLPPENYQNGCTDAEWHYRAQLLCEKIEEVIYTYKYDVLFPTLAQRKFAHKKAVDYLHNPNPQKLIEYFVSLGAEPEDIAVTFRPFKDWEADADGWNTYVMRQDILKILSEQYGIAPEIP